jgi:hypothetical protein
MGDIRKVAGSGKSSFSTISLKKKYLCDQSVFIVDFVISFFSLTN